MLGLNTYYKRQKLRIDIENNDEIYRLNKICLYLIKNTNNYKQENI